MHTVIFFLWLVRHEFIYTFIINYISSYIDLYHGWESRIWFYFILFWGVFTMLTEFFLKMLWPFGLWYFNLINGIWMKFKYKNILFLSEIPDSNDFLSYKKVMSKNVVLKSNKLGFRKKKSNKLLQFFYKKL